MILIKIGFALSGPPLPMPPDMRSIKLLKHEGSGIVMTSDVWDKLFETGLVDVKERDNLKEIGSGPLVAMP